MKEKVLKQILAYCAPLAGALAAVFVFTQIARTPDTIIVLTLVLAVLLCSLFLGLGSGLTASIAGALCYNFFFIPPVGTFTISSAQDIAAFVFFTITAVIVSGLSSAVRKRSQELARKNAEVEKLYALAKILIETPDVPQGAKAIADSIVSIFGFEYCGVHVPDAKGLWRHVSLSSGFPKDIRLPDSGKFRQATLDTLLAENDRHVNYATLRTPKGIIGMLAFRADGVTENVVNAVASLVALTLQRNRIFIAPARSPSKPYRPRAQ